MQINFVITGASKGIGKSLAQKVKETGHYCVGVARESLPNLDQSFKLDLSSINELEAWVEKLELPEEGKIWLINNAGVIDPIGLSGDLQNQEIERHIRLNLIAPMILSNTFIRKWGTERMNIINISSGASHRPYPGWGAYCSAKAGLEMFSRVMNQEHPKLHVISLAPGVVDTEMQSKIRDTPQEAFPMKNKFIQLQQEGLLESPDDIAEKIYKLITKNRIRGICDLRDI